MALILDVASNLFHSDRATGREPRVVRVAWQKDDEAPVVRLIAPIDGMTIDLSTVPYHGLTIADLQSQGVDPAGVIADLEDAARDALTIVSYNQEFHWRQLHRLMGQTSARIPTTAVCAMKLASAVMAEPAMRPGGGFRSQPLSHACDFFELPRPNLEADPIPRACSIIAAVRGVYEACEKGMRS